MLHSTAHHVQTYHEEGDVLVYTHDEHTRHTHAAFHCSTDEQSRDRVVDKSVLEADQKREQVRRKQSKGREGAWDGGGRYF